MKLKNTGTAINVKGSRMGRAYDLVFSPKEEVQVLENGKLQFRLLRADEIDCRIATVKESGITLLLLYKDARVDQNILDETVGPMNWQRRHCRENANCIVSLWDSEKKQWIEKEDTGTESYTEKEKDLLPTASSGRVSTGG